MPEQPTTPMCKFYIQGRCKRGRDCFFSHDPQGRNDALASTADDPEYASCVDHSRRRKKIYIGQVMNDKGKLVWKCNINDPESSCLKNRNKGAPAGNRSQASVPSPSEEEDPYLRAPAPKAALKQPNSKRESLDRAKSPNNEISRPHNDRSRSPGRGRSPTRRSRKASNSAPRAKVSPEACNSARRAKRSPSGSKESKDQDAASSDGPSSRSRSVPKTKKTHQCRIHKKYGVQLDADTPTCPLSHVLTFTRIVRLAQFVEPKCFDCHIRIRTGEGCSVCYRCDPLFMLCVQCTFAISKDRVQIY
jgi:hypothetical protein